MSYLLFWVFVVVVLALLAGFFAVGPAVVLALTAGFFAAVGFLAVVFALLVASVAEEGFFATVFFGAGTRFPAGLPDGTEIIEFRVLTSFLYLVIKSSFSCIMRVRLAISLSLSVSGTALWTLIEKSLRIFM